MKLIKTIKIGRHQSNDYCLNSFNEKTSRNHAILYIYDDDTHELEDISTNGTFVNGNKVLASKVKVRKDDLIKFADQERFDWSRVNAVPINKTGWVVYVGLITIVLLATAWLGYYLFLLPKDLCKDELCEIKCIQAKYNKSVGLICNAYFLKVNFGSDKLFIGYDKAKYNKDQTLEKSVRYNKDELLPFFLTGTAFLIENKSNHDKANLATNRHVADPSWGINKRVYRDDEEKKFYEDIRIETDQFEKTYKLPPNPNRQFITQSDRILFIPSGTLFSLGNGLTYNDLLNKLGTGNCELLRWSKESNVDIALLATNPEPDYHYINLTNEASDNLDCISVGDEAVILGYSGE
ncbi:MAG: FHA domain-containing protein [Saprospiraceae bacterium]|nr:FHA domain-containing protein [Saprospiraceae bacterium]